MTGSFKLWRAVAAVFVFINVAGAGYAIAMGETMHAAVHVGLLVLGYLGWQFGPWKRRETVPPAQLPDPRVEYLQQSVDAMALEVERIGEAQRFNEKLRAEQGEKPPLKKDQ